MDAVADQTPLDRAATQIIALGQRMDRFGWVPSLGGNISLRLDQATIAITRSGGRKGFLDRDGVIAVDLDGNPLTPGDRPSAETLLHCQIYREIASAGAVLHGHSIAATTLTRLATSGSIAFSGYEMIKAFEGQTTHAATVELPVFDNDQDMQRLSQAIRPHLPPIIPGYALRGHGVYAWGRDAEQAIVHLEALEFLLACEVEQRQQGRTHMPVDPLRGSIAKGQSPF